MTYRCNEKGSAIVYIFIGIALFGALMFMFSRNASQNSSGMTSQQSTIKAQAVIEYGNSVANAVNKLGSNGISENDISFETDLYKAQNGSILNPASGFPNCTDAKCKVFEPKGGNVIAQVPADLGPLPVGAQPYFPYPGGLIAHTINIVDVGTPLPELVLSFHTIPKEVCAEINNLLNNKFTINPPTGTDPGTSDTYSGPFPTSSITLGDSDDVWAKGKTAYCYRMITPTPDLYVYQKVAIVR